MRRLESYFLQVNISILETELNKRATQAADQVERACLARLTFYTNLLQITRTTCLQPLIWGSLISLTIRASLSQPV